MGTIALSVLIIALVYTLTPENYRSPGFGLKEMWTFVVLPVESTIIGYLIGSRSKENGG